MSQNEAVMSVHGVVSQESMHKDQHVRNVNIFNNCKFNFYRWVEMVINS